MIPVPLTSGAYSSRSIIANCQRCVNLYPEANPKDTNPPVPVTHYPRPGKTQRGIPPALGRGRGMYRATNGDLYAVVDDVLYFVNDAFAFTAIGNVGHGTSMLSMADNGEDVGDDMVVVDGSTNGWVVTLSSRAFAAVVDGTGTFVGSTRVDYLQGYFLFNAPGTSYWYWSIPYTVTFNALDVQPKSSYADNIQAVAVRKREPWLIGELTTEPWYLSGAPDATFEAVASSFVQYGCVAPYSVQSIDVSIFWVSQDLKGKGVVVRTNGYEVERISTHAIENALQSYETIADAVGASYQVEGHTFYVINFPTADKTWVYDLATKQWHELMWLDNEGVEHRDRVISYAHAYGMILGQDWETGIIYEIDTENYSDNGDPVLYIRGFPHVLDMLVRITHWALIVDIQCGTIEDPDDTPEVMMRYSDDRGKTWSDIMTAPMGVQGDYQASPQFNALGMARDRVYEISWSVDIQTALNGIYLEPEPSET